MGHWQDSTSTPYVTPQTTDAWAAEAASRGATGTQRLLAARTEPPTPDVRQALDLLPDDMVVVRRRLILADDHPVELADSYYPADLAVGSALAEAKKIKGGSVRVLAELGLSIDRTTETITARLPSAEEAELLNITGSQPLLVLARVSMSVDGRPVEYAVNRMVPGASTPLVYRQQVGGP